MISSFLKIALFVAALSAITIGASYLIDLGGMVRFEIRGTEFNLSTFTAVLIALAGFAAIHLALWVVGLLVALYRFITWEETAISRYFARNRRGSGVRMMAEGAVLALRGDRDQALERFRKGGEHLRRKEITLLIEGLEHERHGSAKQAERAYKKLHKVKGGEFEGLFGILRLRVSAKDYDGALRLARKAAEMNPGHREALDLLLRLAARAGQWEEAQAAAASLRKRRLVSDSEHSAILSAIGLAKARRMHAGEGELAYEAEILSVSGKNPGFAPAAVLAAGIKAGKGEIQAAESTLAKAWGAGPHPDIARAFADLVPEETPEARLERLKQLLKSSPGHPETVMMRAELLIEAGSPAEAKEALESMLETAPSPRGFALMAVAESEAGSPEAVARSALLKASDASGWSCRMCGEAHARWEAFCLACGDFHSVEWRGGGQAGSGAANPDFAPFIFGGPVCERFFGKRVNIIVDSAPVVDSSEPYDPGLPEESKPT